MPQPRRTKPVRRSPMPEITLIGEVFATRRIQLGFPEQLLADLAGPWRSPVQAVEHATGSVKLGSIVEMAEVLGLRLEITTIDSTAPCRSLLLVSTSAPSGGGALEPHTAPRPPPPPSPFSCGLPPPPPAGAPDLYLDDEVVASLERMP